MKKKNMNDANNGEPTSKQSKRSDTLAKSLLKEHYSEAEEMKAEEKFEWKDIGDGFYSVGTKNGPKTLCFGSDCVSGKKFESDAEAKKYVNKKPWPLIMMVAAIYTERINNIKNKQN